ncbi:MAG: mechanosensitive ion channel [Nitrospirales bacterium]|nr:mechanosensitive ion channel [Nitrospira sp.]MDR4499890.1 mechanosensitive ion channel [Nitrospirales bacterium]
MQLSDIRLFTVFIQASMADWAEQFTQSFTASVSDVVSFFPTLLEALLLLLLGVLLAKLVGVATTRLLRLFGLDRLLGRTAIQTLLERSGTKKKISEILGMTSFWVIFLLFLISASRTVGLAIVSEALTSLAYYIPKVGIAILILVLGLMAANFVRELILLACSTAGIVQGAIVAQAFYVAGILLVVVTAINELGIDTGLLNNTITLLVAGLIAGAALSFGLGSRAAVANLIAAHYLQSIVRVGLHVRMGEIQGTVVAMTPVSVVVETDSGRVVIPASQFNDTTAVISSPET